MTAPSDPTRTTAPTPPAGTDPAASTEPAPTPATDAPQGDGTTTSRETSKGAINNVR